MSDKNKEVIRFKRMPERGEIFDLFRQVTEKIRKEKKSSGKA